MSNSSLVSSLSEASGFRLSWVEISQESLKTVCIYIYICIYIKTTSLCFHPTDPVPCANASKRTNEYTRLRQLYGVSKVDPKGIQPRAHTQSSEAFMAAGLPSSHGSAASTPR